MGSVPVLDREKGVHVRGALFSRWLADAAGAGGDKSGWGARWVCVKKISVWLHNILLQSSLDPLDDLDSAAAHLIHMDTLTSHSMPYLCGPSNIWDWIRVIPLRRMVLIDRQGGMQTNGNGAAKSK